MNKRASRGDKTRGGRLPGLGASLTAVALLLLAAVPTRAAADDSETRTLTVRVLDQRTERPIEGAEVGFDGNVAPTDAQGEVDFSYRPGSARPVRVQASGYQSEDETLSAARQQESGDDGRPLVVRLTPFETVVLKLHLVDAGTRMPIRKAKKAKLSLYGKSYDFKDGKLKLELNYLNVQTRHTLGGDPTLLAEAEGYQPLEIEFPLKALAEQQRTHGRLFSIPLPLKRLPDADTIRLNINLEDGNADPVVGASATVEVDGFGRQGAPGGGSTFRFSRAQLVRFRDAIQDYLVVRAQAVGFQGPVIHKLPIADLLRAMDQGKADYGLALQLQRAVARPGLSVSVTPSSQQVTAGSAVTIRYRVKNDGNVPLKGVSVQDSSCSPPRYKSGDSDGDGELDPGESWLFECSSKPQGNLAGRVQVSGTTPGGAVVRVGAPVSVVVSACPPPQIEAPDVRGLDRSRAEDRLRLAGFQEVLATWVEDDSADPDRVLDQSPPPLQCRDPGTPIVLVVAKPAPETEPASGLRASLECRAGLEVTAGARPSRTCGVVVRDWAYNDEHVRVTVTNPSPANLSVWPMQDAAWPPNMANPGVADMQFKERYIFTLFFSAPSTATPGVVPVVITVTQGNQTVTLALDVNVLPEGQAPSQGSGIRPPADVTTGSGGKYCVWRSKAFGDPPPCFEFNIAACGTEAYAGNAKYELIGSDMTKLEASLRMSELSRYGGDAYGCRAWGDTQDDDDYDEPGEPGNLRAELECPAGLEIAPGAKPSRTCGVIVRGWAQNDENVRVSVSHPGGRNLDVWPMQDAAWPPNMFNPGVADPALKERYIFTLNFSAPSTATSGVIPVDITVTQGGQRIELELNASVLPDGQTPSHGSGIRPPAVVATGSGDYCVWRSKAFGDPPPCFKFNIATCGTEPYAADSKYELVGSGMTKLQASARMSQLSRYGDDEYGCLSWKEPDPHREPPEPPPEPTHTCPDGSVVPKDLPCPAPEPTKTCQDGSVIPADESCPTADPDDDQKTCPDGSQVGTQEDCPEDTTSDDEDGDDGPDPGSLDCSVYGPHAELYWDDGQQEYLCRCQAEYDFHASDRCVPTEELGQCLEYPGTYPSGEFCECSQPDYYWSQQLGRCAPPGEIPETELVDCTAYPGSLPELDSTTGEYQCACPSGTRWSDSLNRCATGSEEDVASLDCSSKPGTVPEMDYYLNQAVCRCPGTNETWSDGAGKCMDASVAQNPGSQPDPPAPEDVQQGQCNGTSESGSDEPRRVQIDIGGVSSLSLTYDTLQKEDRVRAFVDGALVHDSGCIGTGGDVTQPIQVAPTARLLEVDVYPNCTGGRGTDWNFVITCGGAGN